MIPGDVVYDGERMGRHLELREHLRLKELELDLDFELKTDRWI